LGGALGGAAFPAFVKQAKQGSITVLIAKKRWPRRLCARSVGAMAPKTLQFTHLPREMPPKRPPEERRADFAEIYATYARDRGAAQAGRCSQCGVPFCQIHCPLENNIPDWLMLTAEGRLREAYEASAATNTFPEICGRICPQDRLCEGACVIEQAGHGTVTIGAVETFLTETAWAEGWVAPLRPRRALATSVGIIGAGPAGLAAADWLRAEGHAVHVYDRHDRLGGLMIYGIPNFKLEKEVVNRRIERLAAGGVIFHPNTEIGRDITFDDLRARHDAVLIATGVYEPRPLGVPGSDLPGVVKALDYLIASNRKGLGDKVPAFDDGTLDAKGKRVIVIGGGDTAMDCVRTAVRQGAQSVTCLYRRDRANMPGSAREVAHAEEEGVVFEWLAAPRALTGKGRVSGVEVKRMRLGEADADGRRRPEEVPASGYMLEADLVIEALGFEPEDLPRLFGAPGLRLTRHGTVKADLSTYETALPGVYAAGDIVRGASLVVWAIREGRDAAAAIHVRLMTAQHHATAAE
jgi:glutamate synthase (NADPH/NADH) small chain